MIKIFETYDDLVVHSATRLNTFCDTIYFNDLTLEQYEEESNSLKIIIDELYVWIEEYYSLASDMYRHIMDSGDLDNLYMDKAHIYEIKLDTLNKIKNAYYNIWMFIHRYLATKSLDYEKN